MLILFFCKRAYLYLRYRIYLLFFSQTPEIEVNRGSQQEEAQVKKHFHDKNLDFFCNKAAPNTTWSKLKSEMEDEA